MVTFLAKDGSFIKNVDTMTLKQVLSYEGHVFVLLEKDNELLYQEVGIPIVYTAMTKNADIVNMSIINDASTEVDIPFSKKIKRTTYEWDKSSVTISENNGSTVVQTFYEKVQGKKRQTDNGFGEQAAQRRAAKKLALQNELLATDLTDIKKPKSTKKSAPNVTWWPLDDPKMMKKVQPMHIDWNDHSTNEHANYLVAQFLKMSFYGGNDLKMTGQMLVMPTGAGKTAVAVATAGKLQKALNKKLTLIVTAPAQAISGKGFLATILSWNEAFPDNNLNVLTVTSIDKFASALDHPKTTKAILKEVAENGFLIMDEAHKYKSPTSKRSKKMHKLKFLPKLMISATPIGNDVIMDKCSYLIHANFYNSKSNFMDVSNLYSWVNERGMLLVYNEDGSVRKQAWPYYYTMQDEWAKVLYRPKVDVSTLGMPYLHTEIIQLPENEQLKADMYSLLKAYNNRMFDSFIDFWMEYVVRLCQDEQRVQALLDILNKPETKQPIIFYWNTEVREFLVERLQKEGFRPRIVAANFKYEDIDQHSNEPILVQYQSGAEAIELKQSNTTVFYQNQTSYITLFQARGRNVRRGMNHDVTHYHIIADEPTDMKVFEKAFNRQRIAEEDLEEASQLAKDYKMNEELLEELIQDVWKNC